MNTVRKAMFSLLVHGRPYSRLRLASEGERERLGPWRLLHREYERMSEVRELAPLVVSQWWYGCRRELGWLTKGK